MKSILITGASGFIGSFLVEEALNKGFEVYAGIRKSSSKSFLTNERIKFIELNYSNIEELTETLKQKPFDYIIHNAGLTQTSNQKEYYTVNCDYTRNFIEAIKKSGNIPQKFVYTSSLASYGPGSNTDIKPVRETDTPNPITAYGKSKLEAEKYIKSLTDFPYVIIRPTAVYGPREKNMYVVFKMLNKHIEAYMGFKKQHLTFIYVKDLIDSFFLALESSVTQKGFFITDGNQYSAEELNAIIKKNLSKKTIKLKVPLGIVRVAAFFTEKITNLTGKVSIFNLEKVNELESLNWLCDTQPAIDDLRFQPKYNLEKGMEETTKWYKKNKWL